MDLTSTATSSPLTSMRISITYGSDYTRVHLDTGGLTRTGFRLERKGSVRMAGTPISAACNDVEEVLGGIAEVLQQARLVALKADLKMHTP